MTSWTDSDEFAQMCAVQLASVEGTFLGSGFFVAQRVVATCAHVVEKLDELVVGWNGQALPARVLVREPAVRRGPGTYPYPDLAFIGVETLDNPSAYLESARLGRDQRTLRIFGFSRYTPERSVFRPEQNAEPDISDVQVIGHSGAYAPT
jgi:Trypsin-like peptidase domain